jgi:alpha-tubulin suppressor-like RCC1 family protein
MRSVRISRPVLLIVGVGLCVVVAAVAVALVLAHRSTARPTGTAIGGTTGGTIEYWGGTSAQNKHLTPAALRLPAPVREVGSSNSSDYALLTNGTVYAWGLGTEGELGDGHTVNSDNTPVQVKFPAGVKIVSIPADVMPYNSAFAVDTKGHVWAWGANKGGEFCLGNRKQYNTPVRLPFAHVTVLAGAGDHATYDDDGTLYSCGNNQYGQLGNGRRQFRVSPARVAGLKGERVTSLVASWSNTGALLANGEYFDWGYNATGQLGNGTIGKPSYVPVRVMLPDAVTQVALGGSKPSNGQTLVLLSDGSLYAWGNDSTYQLGDGKTATEARPERILPPAGVTYRALASGGSTSYAISTTGNVYAWGSDRAGAVGEDGSVKAAKRPVTRPVKVESGARTISSTAGIVLVSVGNTRA